MLLFVCQVYAPIDDLDRSLYAFCCKNECCSIHSSSWVVVRNQILQKECSIVPSVASTTDSKTESLFSWDEDEDMSDLIALVNKREKGKESKNEIPASATLHINQSPPKTIDLSQSNELQVSEVGYPAWLIVDNGNEGGEYVPPKVMTRFPRYGPKFTANNAPNCKALSTAKEMDDPTIESDELAEYEEDLEDDEEEVMDPSKLLRLLDSYGEESENALIVSQLKENIINKMNKDSSSISKTNVHTHSNAIPLGRVHLHASAYIQTQFKKDNLHATPDSTSLPSTSGMNQYRTAVEQFFQKVLSYNPQQILRYQYGTIEDQIQPLWCSVVYPSMYNNVSLGKNYSNAATIHSIRHGDELLSHCSGCGARRVFEFQLMPALISYYSKLKGIASTDISNTTGIDFGVVAVYVCPNSCNNSIIEQAVVQAPADMIVT